MIDAITAIDNLGMEDPTADVSPANLEASAALEESQGSSIQETDMSQALMKMLSNMMANTEAANTDDNPSLQLASDQTVEEALADAIPGLDPTTINPSDPLAQDSNLNKMMGTPDNLNAPESLGQAFQTVSDGFEGLSNSFELLAATFFAQEDGVDTVAIGTEGDDTNADLAVNNVAIADGIDPNMDMDMNVDIDFDALKVNVDQVSKGLQFLVQQLEAAFEENDVANPL